MMQALQPAIAPAAWRHEGGDKESTAKGTRAGAVPLLDRRFPADTCTLFCLGALTWPQGRERFRALGLPPLAFMDNDARALAAMLIADREPTAADLEILGRDDGQHTRWIAALECHCPTDPQWAVHSVERFAEAHAGRWLPPYLRWAAERMEAGAWTLTHAARELDALLRLVRPPLAEGRAA